ncbi:MAG TPA: hypothetical protein VFN37_09910 [Candidatus Baltobacteraceae bacterium]|nr:hypothetical protein [Candidatus Baltobacteraceae bacterium]
MSALAPLPAGAWGPKGHHLVNGLAAQALPASMPAFMRTAQARAELTYLGLELDLQKGAGKEWDADLDPGHYLDIAGNGVIAGGLPLHALPLTREAYDTQLRARGGDQYETGYLPYSIVQGWEQLRMDFAYWRVDDYESVHASSQQVRAAAAQRRTFDQALVLRDAGVWGHYVADASQPLHVTVHFNGWGKYPNPSGYSQSTHLHDLFETEFVDRFVTPADVRAQMSKAAPVRAAHLTTDAQILTAVEAYLTRSNANVEPLYRIEKSGGFRTGSRQARTFTAGCLALGADELRDLTVWAWDDSLNQTIGDDFPQSVRSILSGTPYKGL